MFLTARNFFDPAFSGIFSGMENLFRTPQSGLNRTSLMKTDIREEDGLYLIEMDVPGYDKENIKVELKDGYLSVSAEQNSESSNETEDGYVMKERHFGSCSRSFFVGKDIKEDDIKAAYKDGVLHLSLPTQKSLPENQPKLIDIA